MLDFVKIANDSYVLYCGGKRITPVPLTKKELFDKLNGLTLSDSERAFIERFYGGENHVGNS